jgi:hypothetical protein
VSNTKEIGLTVSVACTKRKDVLAAFCLKILNENTTFYTWAQIVGKH